MGKKTGSKLYQRLMALAIVMLLSLGMTVQAFATSSANTAVTDDRAGVMCIEYGIVKDNKFIPIYMGSSFLINSNTLLTCYHVVHLTDGDVIPDGNGDLVDARDYMKDNFGDKWESKMAIRAILANGSEVNVTETVANEKVDYSVLTLNQDIHDHAYLALRETPVATSEQIFALGFPYVVTDLTEGTATKFTAEDVSVTSGTISKGDTMVDGMHYVQHNATLKGGNSGGPLVDSEGVVVGINSAVDTSTGDYGYAIAIDQVILTLKGLGIPYTSASDASAENKGSEVNVVNNGGAAPAETEAAPETQATETKAPETEKQTEAVPAASDILPPADSQPAGKGMNPIMLIGIIAAIAIAVVVILILVMGRKKGDPEPPYIPDPGPSGGFKPTQKQSVSYDPSSFEDSGEIGTGVLNEAESQTSVLFGDAGGTTVLSQQPFAELIRKSNGDHINVNADNFIIGRERKRVNYCVSNNTAVGRAHAKIVKNGANVSVIDLSSTNGTYVNDVKCAPNAAVALKTGDKLVLADEEFEVRIL